MPGYLGAGASGDDGRRRGKRVARAALGLALAVGAGNVEGQKAQAAAEIPGSHTSTLIGSHGYGKPNQSRVWFNSVVGRWDALVPRNDGGSSASDHYIVLDLTGAPAFTGVELEDRNGGRPDVFWDDLGHRLYVLGSHTSTPLFWRVLYNPATDNYSVDPLADGIVVPGVAHATDNWPSTIHVSPNGHVWAAALRDGALAVQHSADGGTSWMSAAAVLDADVRGGVTCWSHFALAGTINVGLFAGENGDPAAETEFMYWYIDQNADPSNPVHWTDESVAIPAAVAGEDSDDHVRAARDEDGNQYFVTKTENGAPTAPRIQLLKRTPYGVWWRYGITAAEDRPRQTRPSLVVDDRNDRLYVFTTDEGGGAGVRVRVPLDRLDLLAMAPQVVLFDQPATMFNDLIAPRDHVEQASGVVVLAHDASRETIWVATETIVDRGPGDPLAAPDTGVVVIGGTLDVAAPGVLANDIDLQGDPISASLVGRPAHGVLTLNPDGSYSYVHDGSATVADVFHYEVVDDGGATSDVVAVNLVVNPL